MYRMMVVDDSSIIRNKISRSIDEDNFEIVAQAHNGLDALHKFKTHSPDLVTMDMTMPELDGLGCIEELKKLDDNVRILVISALSDDETGLLALVKGASGFLKKPFTEMQLINALTIMMDD